MPGPPDGFPDLQAINEELHWRQSHRLEMLFRDAGQFRRQLYAKHLQFFALGGKHAVYVGCPEGCEGKPHRERCFMAGNRVGKTVTGAYEATLHATGMYPDWWTGRRFDKPTRGWACGTTNQKTAEIVQAELFGILHPEKAGGRPIGLGTGIIPRYSIEHVRMNPQSPGAISKAWVRHVSGGRSTISFKSYEAGRKAYEGETQDWIWLDEECPLDIYAECVTRTMTTDGIILLTFTPLQGISDVVKQFVAEACDDGKIAPSRAIVQANWDDVPHLTEHAKEELWASTPPYQREARRYGKPSLGSGAIYPVAESEILEPAFDIPDHWPRVYGLDVGWNRTAAIWGAWDRETDCLHLYSEHYRGEAEPSIHAEAIRARGKWIPGVIDPASKGRSQVDGQQLLSLYRALGLSLAPATPAVETGIYEVWQRLSTSRLKVFESLSNWLSEFRLYRRDERGRIVKEKDHLMDAMRYLVMSGLSRAKAVPVKQMKTLDDFENVDSWMVS